MIEIQSYNEQIVDTQKLINNMLGRHGEDIDDLTQFMLEQNQVLLETLKQERLALTFQFFVSKSSAFEILSDVYKVIPFNISPKMIATTFGIDVLMNNNLEDNDIGKCYVKDYVITIEYKPMHPHRDKFTIAHELGHITKHMSHGIRDSFSDTEEDFNFYAPVNRSDYKPEELKYARNGDNDSMSTLEVEADIFAGTLLLPKENVTKLLEQIGSDESLKTTLISDLAQIAKGTVYHTLRQYGLWFSDKIEDTYIWE